MYDEAQKNKRLIKAKKGGIYQDVPFRIKYKRD